MSVSDRCEVCGLALARGDSGDGPAVFMTFILGFTVVPVALWVAMSVDWPLWLHAAVWTVVILGLALGMLRPAKAYLMGPPVPPPRQRIRHPRDPGVSGGPPELRNHGCPR
ncbi:DUF983 domain-containing protein [Skermanella sp. TT6]|uniref:DUF983 domain-containing protein n=1 Tax=Skermanella cutis TaxID=2775420 RepID=UPI001FFFB7CB|nr:DUF983 domain-containing protein [Skermanella sp. TT6]